MHKKVFLSMKNSPGLLLAGVFAAVLISLLLFVQDATAGQAAVQIFPVASPEPFPGACVLTEDDTADSIDLSAGMEYFFDETGAMGFEEIRADAPFSPAGGRTHWGVRDEVCWFRVGVESRLDETSHFYASNLVDHVPFSVEPGQTVLIYYRLEYSDAGIVCTPSVTPGFVHIKERQNHMVYVSIMLGIYIALFLYNLMLSIWTKDSAYHAYLLALVFFTCMLVFRQFDVAFGSRDIASAAFTLPAYIFVLLFTREYLQIRKIGEKPEYLFRAMLGTGLVVLILSGFISRIGPVLRYSYSLLLFVYGLYVSLISLKTFRRKAVLYLISWGPAFFVMLLVCVSQLGFFSPDKYPLPGFLISNPGSYLVVAFQMITLSLALGNRINVQQEAVNTAQRDNLRLMELDAQKNRFLVNISHELRTPLTVITGTLNAVKRGYFGQLPPRLHDAVEVMQRNGSRLDTQIRNLLYLSRINDAPDSINLTTADIVKPFSAIVRDFSSLAISRNIEYSHELPGTDTVYPVMYNKTLFELAVVNILSNAFKFTPDKGRIAVSMSAEEGRRCVVSISDTGAGIPEEDQQKIFLRFYRGSYTKQHAREGVGIGLTLVKRCMDIMGGSVTVRSAEGEGTTVFLSFPLRDKAEIQDPRENTPADDQVGTFVDALRPGPVLYEAPSAKEDREEKSRPVILVVEDNPDLLALIKMEMSDFFTIETAGDGKAGLALLKAGIKPDLIITDILMPEMDGISFFREVRGGTEGGIPFIFLSAIGDEEKKRELMEEGAVDFLSKPFPPEQLARKVRNLLSWKKSELKQERDRIKKAVLSAIYDESGSDETLRIRYQFDRYSLTEREREIAGMVLGGMRDKEIAHSLGLAQSTVSNYLQRIYRKTGTSGRASLVKVLME